MRGIVDVRLDIGGNIAAAGLKAQHGRVGCFTQASRQSATGRTGSNDHEIVAASSSLSD